MDIAQQLTSIVKVMKVQFSFKGRPLSFAEVFSEDGALPGLAKRADGRALMTLGYGIGATFEDSIDSLLGSKVSFDEYTPGVLRLLCILDVIDELMKGSGAQSKIISLDELMYD